MNDSGGRQRADFHDSRNLIKRFPGKKSRDCFAEENHCCPLQRKPFKRFRLKKFDWTFDVNS